MTYISTLPETEAPATLKDLYDSAKQHVGYIPHYLSAFSHRPEVYKAWQSLISTIRGNMTLRRYELVTLAAAHTLKGTYCMYAHADALLKSGEVNEVQLKAIAKDFHEAQLPADEIAILTFATKISTDASSVTQADVDQLKGFGISDAEILDIVLATAARSFFSKVLDALAVEPDAKYGNFDADIRSALTVGRAFEPATV